MHNMITEQSEIFNQPHVTNHLITGICAYINYMYITGKFKTSQQQASKVRPTTTHAAQQK